MKIWEVDENFIKETEENEGRRDDGRNSLFSEERKEGPMTEFRGYNEQDLGIENNAASTNRKVRFIYHCYNNEKVTAERFAGHQTNYSPIACHFSFTSARVRPTVSTPPKR